MFNFMDFYYSFYSQELFTFGEQLDEGVQKYINRPLIMRYKATVLNYQIVALVVLLPTYFISLLFHVRLLSNPIFQQDLLRWAVVRSTKK